MRTRHSEGRLWMEQAVTRSEDVPAEMRAKALWALRACVYGSRYDERLIAISEESPALFRRAGDRHGEAYALRMVGFATLQLGELEHANRVLDELLRIFREYKDDWGSAHILTHLAVVPLRQDDYPRAAVYAEEALELTRRTGDRLVANIALHLLAQTARRRASEDGRANTFETRSSLPWCQTERTPPTACRGSRRSPKHHRASHATRLLGAAEALLEAAGIHQLYAQMDHELHQRVVDAVPERLGERAWKEARDEGRAMSFEEAVAYVAEVPKLRLHREPRRLL